MYNIYKIDNNKLVQMFNKSFTDVEEGLKLIGYWYTSFRSNKEIEFLIIDQIDKKSMLINYNSFDYERSDLYK